MPYCVDNVWHAYQMLTGALLIRPTQSSGSAEPPGVLTLYPEGKGLPWDRIGRQSLCGSSCWKRCGSGRSQRCAESQSVDGYLLPTTYCGCGSSSSMRTRTSGCVLLVSDAKPITTLKAMMSATTATSTAMLTESGGEGGGGGGGGGGGAGAKGEGGGGDGGGGGGVGSGDGEGAGGGGG